MNDTGKKMPKSCRDLTLAQIAQIHIAPFCHARSASIHTTAEVAELLAYHTPARIDILPTEKWRDNPTVAKLQANKTPHKLLFANGTVMLATGIKMGERNRQTRVSAFFCHTRDLCNSTDACNLINRPDKFAMIVGTDEEVDEAIDELERNLTFCNWVEIIDSIYRPLCDYSPPLLFADAETLYAAELLRTTNPWALELHELPPLIQAAKVVANAKKSFERGGYFVSAHGNNEQPENAV